MDSSHQGKGTVPFVGTREGEAFPTVVLPGLRLSAQLVLTGYLPHLSGTAPKVGEAEPGAPSLCPGSASGHSPTCPRPAPASAVLTGGGGISAGLSRDAGCGGGRAQGNRGKGPRPQEGRGPPGGAAGIGSNALRPPVVHGQADLASATEALQRSKPISAQLTSCLSKKVHCDKNVELTAKVMKETDELALVNREAYAAAVKAQSELEEELQRLTLLHTAPAPAGAVPAGAAAALLSALTPSMALQLQLLASLLQGPGRAAILAAASPGLEPSSSVPPQGEGNATPRPSPTTPPAKDDRGAGPGTSGSKARSRSPNDRKGDLAGVHHVGFQIDGLTQLQAVLGLFVAECTSVQDNGAEDMKEDEL